MQGDRLRIEDMERESISDEDINSRSTIDFSTRPYDLNFFTEDIATIWRINYPLNLVTDPDTMAEQIFVRVADPEPQEEINTRCRSERIIGTYYWLLDTDEF